MRDRPIRVDAGRRGGHKPARAPVRDQCHIAIAVRTSQAFKHRASPRQHALAAIPTRKPSARLAAHHRIEHILVLIDPLLTLDAFHLPGVDLMHTELQRQRQGRISGDPAAPGRALRRAAASPDAASASENAAPNAA